MESKGPRSIRQEPHMRGPVTLPWLFPVLALRDAVPGGGTERCGGSPWSGSKSLGDDTQRSSATARAPAEQRCRKVLPRSQHRSWRPVGSPHLYHGC